MNQSKKKSPPGRRSVFSDQAEGGVGLPKIPLPGSPLLLPEDDFDNPPMINGDFVCSLFEAARKHMAEADLLALVRERGWARPLRLDAFLKDIKESPRVMAEFFVAASARLTELGTAAEEVARVDFERRVKSRGNLDYVLHAMALHSSQPWSIHPRDIIGCAYQALSRLQSRLDNFRLMEVRFGSRQGDRQTARITIIPLCRLGLSAALMERTRHELALIPRLFKSKPALLAPSPVGDGSMDGQWLGQKAPHSVRPSLKELAELPGVKLEVRNKVAYLNDKPVAVADNDPARVVSTDLYRMTTDVGWTGWKLKIEKPGRMEEGGGQTLLAGQMVHLDHGLAACELELSYPVGRAKSLALLGGAKITGMIWEQIGEGLSHNPWSNALEILDHGGADPDAWLFPDRFPDKSFLEPILKAAEIKSKLTPKESAVLLHVLMGLNNHEIADQLGSELNTIKSHLQIILDKTGQKNRLMLISYFLGATIFQGRDRPDLDDD